MTECVETSYISCACNPAPHCAHWGKNGLVCYGACQAVAIYNPSLPGRVTHTLTGHTGRVNCVKWISQSEDEEEVEIVSGSSDSTLRVWRKEGNHYVESCQLKGHTDVVTTLDSLTIGGHVTIASAAADSTVLIWDRSVGKEDFECTQKLAFGSGFVLDITLVKLCGIKKPLLVCGGDDMRVHLYVKINDQMQQVLSLTGHEDWIRGLAAATEESGSILLASCSQDCYIRLWKIATGSSADKVPDDQDEIQMKEITFSVPAAEGLVHYTVSLESVLAGHENWVYSVQWQPPVFLDGRKHQPLCLLSSSMDKTMILWQPDPESGVWLEQVRVGEVGGDNLGFYGGLFGPTGRSVLAHGYQGAFHLWHQEKETSTWQPGIQVGGHFDAVQDLAWQPQTGNFLLSVSTDQTTRLHALWIDQHTNLKAWHEVARPQIHGYDLQCLAFIGRYSFTSGADEKLLRVFEAPKNFIENLERICNINLKQDMECKGKAEGASIPALGLSNKAVYQGEPQQDLYEERQVAPPRNAMYAELYFSPQVLNAPPTEEQLLQHTLWPEVQKLYGHGYELFAVACHPSGSPLASACKAAKAEHANIILWDTSSWQQIGQLKGHTLTITQLAFSHNGKDLLSVSRDRTWNLYSQDPGSGSFQWRCGTGKKNSVHTRIIWSCSWSHDDLHFATASRDRKIVVWDRQHMVDEKDVDIAKCHTHTVQEAVTAVDFAPLKSKDDRYMLAVGLESGCIILLLLDSTAPASSSWTLYHQLLQPMAHHLTIKRLAFRPLQQEKEKDTRSHVSLASCGADHIVKIHRIQWDSLS